MSLVLVFLYASGLVFLGLRLRSGSGRAEKYVADRSLGTTAVASTLAATSIGGSATVALAGYVYSRGLPGLWLDLPLAAGLMATGLLLAGRIRSSRALSLPHLASMHYGRRFRRALALLVLGAEVAWFALLTRAAAPFLGQMTGLGETAGILATAGVFTFYTAIGGQRAVAASDSLQLALVMFFGLLLPAGIVLTKTGLLAGLPPDATAFPCGPGLGWQAILGLFAMMALPGMAGGDVYGKVLSAKGEKEARRGSIAAGVVKLVAAACVAVLALGARLMLSPGQNGDEVLSSVLSEALPPVLLPLTWLAFLAAMMSSADSVLLTGATVLDVDLLPTGRLQWLRPVLVITALAAAGTAAALAAPGIVPLLLWAYTVFAAGAPLPILAALLLPERLAGGWATAALCSGGLVAALAKLAGRTSPVLPGLGVSAVLIAAGLLWSSIRPVVHRSGKELDPRPGPPLEG